MQHLQEENARLLKENERLLELCNRPVYVTAPPPPPPAIPPANSYEIQGATALSNISAHLANISATLTTISITLNKETP